MLSSNSKGASLFAIAKDYLTYYESGNVTFSIKEILTHSTQKSQDNGKQNGNEEQPGVLCSCISPSGNYFAMSSTSKTVRIYKREQNIWTLLKEQPLAKKAGCMNFMPDEKTLLVGEKSGYVVNIAVDGTVAPLLGVGEQDEFLGHLSLLTSVVSSKDGKYIGTCDRDEKIRISRFSQPFVIEAFCLGHKKPVTEIAFLENNHLISVASDGFLRLWDALEGLELDALDLTPHVDKLRPSSEAKEFLATRLLIVDNVALLGVRSHDCILAVKLIDNFAKLGEVCGICCPQKERFVDCCVINHQPTDCKFEVVCMTEPVSRLLSWTVEYGVDGPASWSQVKEWDPLPEEMKTENGHFPRLQMLTEMGRSFVDVSGIDAYERSKEETHKRIRQRHQRHQARRKRQKFNKDGDKDDDGKGEEAPAEAMSS